MSTQFGPPLWAETLELRRYQLPLLSAAGMNVGPLLGRRHGLHAVVLGSANRQCQT